MSALVQAPTGKVFSPTISRQNIGRHIDGLSEQSSTLLIDLSAGLSDQKIAGSLRVEVARLPLLMEKLFRSLKLSTKLSMGEKRAAAILMNRIYEKPGPINEEHAEFLLYALELSAEKVAVPDLRLGNEERALPLATAKSAIVDELTAAPQPEEVREVPVDEPRLIIEAPEPEEAGSDVLLAEPVQEVQPPAPEGSDPLLSRIMKIMNRKPITERRALILDTLIVEGTVARIAAALGVEANGVSASLSQLKAIFKVPTVEAEGRKEGAKQELVVLARAWARYRGRELAEASPPDSSTKVVEETPLDAEPIVELCELAPPAPNLEVSLFTDAEREAVVARIKRAMKARKLSVRRIEVLDALAAAGSVTLAAKAVHASTGGVSTIATHAKGLFGLPKREEKSAETKALIEAWSIYRELTATMPKQKDGSIARKRPEAPTPPLVAAAEPAEAPAPAVESEARVEPPETAPLMAMTKQEPSSSAILRQPDAVLGVRTLWTNVPDFVDEQDRLIAEGYQVERVDHLVSFHPVIQGVSVLTFVKRA